MNEEYYRLLGLEEGVTDEELTLRYQQLVEKYKEERWQEGEIGNQAAKMLTKIEVAYKEIMESRSEKREETQEGDNALAEVAKYLKANDVEKAQEKLDLFNERGAEWHYLQAVVFYKKNWYNESKKQLEIAMRIDPSNGKYREAYEKLNEKDNYEKAQNGENNPYGNGGSYDYPQRNEQMGGAMSNPCCCCCCASLCLDLMTSCCCYDRRL
ncbi:MAG: hypothetical protein IJY11_03150 [Clostridia bacterium]|nr:hypothetical protein [Clostridia bacterium]